MPSYDRAFSTGLSGFSWSVISGNGIRVPSGGLSWSPAQRLDIPVLLIQCRAKCSEAICASKAVVAATSYSALSKTDSFKKLFETSERCVKETNSVKPH